MSANESGSISENYYPISDIINESGVVHFDIDSLMNEVSSYVDDLTPHYGRKGGSVKKQFIGLNFSILLF